jgi:hypothetical protein
MKVAGRNRFAVLPALMLFALPLQADEAGDVERLRKASFELTDRLGAELKHALEQGGAVKAVSVCRDLAPAIAGEMSRQNGWRVTRVSLRPRNPLLGSADVWEQQQLLRFDQRAAAGELPDQLEVSEIVTEPSGRYLRYARALPVQPACLMCHGEAQQLAPSVAAELGERYPYDRAIGYGLGQLRGAVSIKMAQP